MSSNIIDAPLMVKMFIAGARNLEAKKEWVNELNVFPVPDGDTGTNMTLTILSAVDEVKAIESPTLETVAKAMSSGSLRGARGNSGVILSQLLRGFSKICRNEKEIDVKTACNAFQKASETAYKAVMKPKEGTILTVARGGAEKAKELFEANPDIPMEEFLTGIIDNMEKVLNETPDMLPVLKEAGVVDSGGEGLLQIMKGAMNAYLGLEEPEDEHAEETVAQKVYTYSAEFIIRTASPITTKNRTKIVAFLESVGGAIAAERDGNDLKIHVHTDEPGDVLTECMKYGSLFSATISNCAEGEHHPVHLFEKEELASAEENAEQDTEEVESPEEASENTDAESTAAESGETAAFESAGEQNEMPHKDVGFIAVSIGDGLGKIFRELGADYLIEGGQTMNPSTQDILTAIEKVNADTIFILPNNKNIILAAGQAQSLTRDKTIIVVPTKTIPQGITALINYLPEKSPQENEELMREEIMNVQTVELTYAVRDTKIDDKEIHSGDIMGVADHGIIAVGKDIADTAVDSVRTLASDDSELVSIYYGKDTSEEDAEKLTERLQKEFPDLEVELNEGGQPIYYYIISVE